MRNALSCLFVLPLLALASGCSSSYAQPAANVAAAPPPKDDGKASKGGNGGLEHAASLEQLKTSAVGLRFDQQKSVRFPLPDADNWTRVKFWTLKSLVGFRYGKEHHAIAGAFVTHVEGTADRASCNKAFEKWAAPYMDAFEVELERAPSIPFSFQGKESMVDVVLAKTATLADHEQYAAAYVVLPQWRNACLIAGVAIPARNEVGRAVAVRDRLAKEILPKIEVIAAEEPKELY